MRNRAEFVKKIIEETHREVELDHIMSFIDDILRYLEGKNDEECKTNQHYVRIQNLFQEHVIKTWFRAKFNSNQHRILNKIAVRLCLEHNDKC